MKNKTMKQANRNFGLDHAAGKGDKSRVSDVKIFRRNYDEINWHREFAGDVYIRQVLSHPTVRKAVKKYALTFNDCERIYQSAMKKAARKIFHAHKDGDAKFSFHGLTWKP